MGGKAGRRYVTDSESGRCTGKWLGKGEGMKGWENEY